MINKSLPPKPKRGTVSAGVGVIYARYSSHRQTDLSIEQQVEACRKLASDMGIDVSAVYADRALSGTTDKRPDFQRLLRDAQKGVFAYLLAWKSNRIGRNMLEALINEGKLVDCGVRIVYVEEDFDDSAAGRFAARNMLNVNQFYSEAMAEDITRAMTANAAECKVNGPLPLGYKRGDDGRYAVDEPKAEIVREIFRRVASGEPQADVVADLNRRGVKNARGQPFGKNGLHTLLCNERYRGVYIFAETRIDGGVPRIIDDALFYAVQEGKTMRQAVRGRHTPGGDYLLTGKLFCGECNEHMIGLSGTGKSGAKHYYYACSRKRSKRDCKKRDVRRDLIETQIAKALQAAVMDDATVEWIADVWESYVKRCNADAEIALLRQQLDETTTAIGNIMSAIERGLISDTMADRLRELETDKKHLDRQIAVLSARQITVTREEIVDWIDTLRHGDPSDKTYQRQLFDLFLVAAYVYDDGRVRVIFSVGDGDKSVDLDPLVDADLDDAGGDRLSPAEVHHCGTKQTPIRLHFTRGAFAFDFWLN